MFVHLRVRHLFAVASWLLVGATVACGPHDERYPDANAFCYGRARAECSTEVVKACAAPSADRCIARRQEACIASIPRRASYNARFADVCIETVSAAYADAKVSQEENRKQTDVCASVFDGPGRANAPCQKDIDCKVSDGFRCVPAAGGSSGFCEVPVHVQGGGVCIQPQQLCIDGFHCGATQHCDINSQVGEPCSDALPCVTSARCGNAGVCEKKSDDGTPCTTDEECANALCARGLSAPLGLCVSQMTLAPNEPFCIDAR